MEGNCYPCRLIKKSTGVINYHVVAPHFLRPSSDCILFHFHQSINNISFHIHMKAPSSKSRLVVDVPVTTILKLFNFLKFKLDQLVSKTYVYLQKGRAVMTTDIFLIDLYLRKGMRIWIYDALILEESMIIADFD